MSFTSLKDAYKKVYNEDVNVTFEDDSGVIQSFRLQDAYANVLKKRILADSGNIVDKYIDTIYTNGDWGGSKQGASKGVFKDIMLNAHYDLSIELLRYLAENKKSLLSIKSFGVGKVRNFIELIKQSLPGELVRDGIDDVIRQVHNNVIPKASTIVGRGESTFTFFGTAVKGRSGDLNWGGFELEIKTGGDSNQGAILGGDGYLNKVSDRLKSATNYTHLKISDLNMIENAVNKAVAGVAIKGSKDFEKFKDLYRKKKVFKSEKLNNAILKSNLDNFINQQVTKDFSVVVRPNPKGGMTLHTALLDRIQEEKQRASELNINLPSQIASYLPDDGSVKDYVNVFSELRTYANTSVNVRKQLVDFFNSHEHTEFSPKNDYDNFTRLVGAIALVIYTENIGFDFMLVCNDVTNEGIILNCGKKTISDVYQQLEQNPRVEFDLNIDVYEGGQWRSQTVIAKSPRIYLK
jgi:hypothetical protein